MAIKIEVNDKTNSGLNPKKLEQLLYKGIRYLKKEKILPLKMKVVISLAIVNLEEIKKINFQYRKKGISTDILSFCYEKTGKILDGELIINLDIIFENAHGCNIDEEKELKNVLMHGLLHLAGFKHSEKMFDLQEKMLNFLEE